MGHRIGRRHRRTLSTRHDVATATEGMWKGEYAAVAGWCAANDDEALEDAKRGTHDALVELLGDRRQGGVAWIVEDGTEAKEVVAMLEHGCTDPALLELYRRLRNLLRVNGGKIVVAVAPGEREP